MYVFYTRPMLSGLPTQVPYMPELWSLQVRIDSPFHEHEQCGHVVLGSEDNIRNLHRLLKLAVEPVMVSYQALMLSSNLDEEETIIEIKLAFGDPPQPDQ